MISVDIDDAELRRELARTTATLRNPKPALADIGEQLAASTKRRFATSTDPSGQPWAQLSDTTLLRELRTKRRQRKRNPARRRPLIGESKRLSREIHYRAHADRVEIGSPMVYAAVHQFGARKRSFSGGRTPWGDIPARRFLGVSAQDRADISAILAEHVLG